MRDTLSPELTKRVRAYCEEILGNFNLPDTAIEELENHFQDRMLGYLNGTDPLTEEDAFVLTRDHFGDARTVREMFAEAQPDTSRVVNYRWYRTGAIFMFVAFVFSTGGLPVLDLVSDRLYPLSLLLFGASLVVLGFVVLVLVIRHGRVMMADRVFGWYFLAYFLGSAIPLRRLLITPLSASLMSLWLVLILAVSVCFFRHVAQVKWILLVLLFLPFISNVVRDRLVDEARAAMVTQPLNQLKQQAQSTDVSSEEPTTTVTTTTRVIWIPPKGFSEAFLVLALLHAFLPRRSRRADPIPDTV